MNSKRVFGIRSVFLIRIFSWFAVIVSLVFVAVRYETLPSEIPVSRWHSASKTLFLAFRIPAINLLTLGLIEVVAVSLRRVTGFSNRPIVEVILFLTIAAKASLEAIAIIALPQQYLWVTVALMSSVTAGICSASYFSRQFLKNEWRSQLTSNRVERIAAASLFFGIIFFNLPLIASGILQ